MAISMWKHSCEECCTAEQLGGPSAAFVGNNCRCPAAQIRGISARPSIHCRHARTGSNAEAWCGSALLLGGGDPLPLRTLLGPLVELLGEVPLGDGHLVPQHRNVLDQPLLWCKSPMLTFQCA